MKAERVKAKTGGRFAFGKNWQRFLSVLNEERITEAERSLREMLQIDDLNGKSFLDIGCGSGLFSLAAMRLGAVKVHSFDFDPQSVACALELKSIYFPDVERWSIERGDVLDAGYLAGLGRWDVVYAWGVLHHTGDMWTALKHAASLPNAGGTLFIAIYNDQGAKSRRWKTVKAFYNKGLAARWATSTAFITYWILRDIKSDLRSRKIPFLRYRQYKRSRGMSRVHDWIDWLGGYPYEVAKPDDLIKFYEAKGFRLLNSILRVNGLGNNELVFESE